MTHVLMLRDGKVVVAGAIEPTLTSANAQRVLRDAADARTTRRRPVQRVVATSCSRRSRPDDLVGQHPLHRSAGPQRAAVVQVHVQRALPSLLDDRVEHPGECGGRRPRRVRTGGGRLGVVQRCAPSAAACYGERTERARNSTSHAGGPSDVEGRRRWASDIHRGIAKVVDETEQPLRGARRVERRIYVHCRQVSTSCS